MVWASQLQWSCHRIFSSRSTNVKYRSFRAVNGT
jgi:hypothetical protein